MAERYKIYEKLGAGGVGAVFRAYDSQLKRWVAIKRLLSANDATGATADELRREADALASLRNPNVVTVFDVATDAEGLFMVMELLEGEDLAHVVQRGPLHYDDFKELASQTLEALLAAHQRHILHRDIKPENIKVERLPGGRMQSKLIDFGLARAGLRARKQTEDQEGTVMGSIYYMAPEQLTREPVDERTDLYSLGCVFYEALSGRKAFDGASMAAVIDQHINHDIVPLHAVAPHVPQWLGAWVARLMAQKPQDRPANAQQAIEEFRAWERMPMMVPYGPWQPYPAAPAMAPAYTPQASLPPGSDTVPLYGYQPVPQAEQAAYAQPVAEPMVLQSQPITEVAAHTTELTGGRPMRPVTGPRPVAVRSAPEAEDKASQRAKAKLYGIIGAAVLVAAAAGFMLLGGKGQSSTSGGAASTSLLGPSGPPKVTLVLPTDRAFPPVSDDICVHLVAGTGMYGNRKGADGNPAAVHVNEPVLEWHDISPLGNNNLMRTFKNDEARAPKLVLWPAQPNVVGAKTNRPVLDFRPRDGKAAAMNLTDVGDEAGHFPFGSAPTKFEKGMTLAFAFQADASRLPTRILTLSADDSVSVSVRVDADKKLIAEVRNGSQATTIAGKNMDPTKPCVAVLAWQASSGTVEFRAKDAFGKDFKIAGSKVQVPAKPMVRLQLGQVEDSKGRPVPAADQFAGYLADVILYSSWLKNDQVQLLESKALREYYFQGPPPPPKK